MKRVHVHVAVDDLDRSVGFYSRLFGADPTVRKPDYAKWMLEDPRLNFAISGRHAETGIRHLGIQVETAEELAEVYDRLRAAEGPGPEEGETTCCYARSEKSWASDPQGVSWEAFLTHGDSDTFGETRADAACCTPETPQGVCCPPKANLTPDAPCCA